MGTEPVPETLYLNQLTQLMAREDYIESCHRESFKTYTFLSVAQINDFIRILLLAVAFLFNWIGFVMLMCFCHTIAARYGALSGFGLSLAKWTLIVKHSTELASGENSWLWWLMLAAGNIA
jgi:hypothetical protein